MTGAAAAALAPSGAYLLDFAEYPMPSVPITVPAGCLFFRAASRFLNGLGEHPLFVGGFKVAQFYYKLDPGRVLEGYKTTRDIRLLDIRYLTQLIPLIITTRPNTPISAETLDFYKKLTAAFGACTLARQCELIAELSGNTDTYSSLRLRATRELIAQTPVAQLPPGVNPVEPAGYRAAFTNVDYEVMHVLKYVLTTVDGLIAPALFTPAHSQPGPNRLFDEVILWKPAAVLEQVSALPTPAELRVRKMTDLLPGATVISALFPMSATPRAAAQNGGRDPAAVAEDPLQIRRERDVFEAFVRDRKSEKRKEFLARAKRIGTEVRRGAAAAAAAASSPLNAFFNPAVARTPAH